MSGSSCSKPGHLAHTHLRKFQVRADEILRVAKEGEGVGDGVGGLLSDLSPTSYIFPVVDYISL
jgi:hypothetical protein